MIQENGPNMNRRRALKLAAGGAASTGLVGIVAGDTERRRRVPRIIDMYGETIETMKVPKGWHDHQQSIKKRKFDFDDEYLPRDGVYGASVIESPDSKHGGRNGFKFKLTINPVTFRGEPPEEYRGVEVKTVEEVGDPRQPISGDLKDEVTVPMSHNDNEGCYYNDHNWATYLGGIPFWRESDSNRGTSWEPNGTHTWLVEYQGTEYIQGARHTYQSCGSDDDVDDEEVYTHDYKNGDVVNWNRSMDVFIATTDEQNFIDTTPMIINEEGTDAWPVTGIHSELSLATMIITNEQYSKMGTATGRRWGFVEEQYDSYFGDCDFDGYGVRGTANAAVGDSGGPAFTVENGGAVLVSMVTHTYTGGNDPTEPECPYLYIRQESTGPAAHRLRDVGYQPVTT